MENTFTGIITKGVGGLYTVRPHLDSDREYVCRARGALRHEKITPVPGDAVEAEFCEESAKPDERSGAAGVITRILPRKNCLVRPAMANLAHMLVTVPASSPKPDLTYVDKLTVIADALGIDCTVIVNKCDLAPDFASDVASEYRAAGFRVFCTDAVSGEGCGELSDFLCGHVGIAAFAGASGAGKSSLTGRLFPFLSPEVGQVSRKTERGRHTTRAVEIYPTGVDGLFIADTPGFSMLDFRRFDFFEAERLPSAFREFAPYLASCRYTDCTHTKEEECAVLSAVKSGAISPRRHESYVRLYSDMREKPEWQRRQEKEDG